MRVMPMETLARAFSEYGTYLPFVGLAMRDENMRTPFITRLVEAALIAVVTAVVVNYGTAQVLSEKVDTLAANQLEIKQTLREMRSDLYKPK